MGALLEVSHYVNAIITIVTFITIFVKPVRERVLGIRQSRDGLKCLLRSEMLRTYYGNKDKKIRQHEFENFMYVYNAYKALGGNSFADRIKDEVKTWEVEH